MIHISHQADALALEPELGNEEDWLRLYEAKMVHHYDHRWVSFERGNPDRPVSVERMDPDALVGPRYFVKKQNVTDRIRSDWKYDWLIGWRDITNSTNERSMVFAILPFAGMSHTLPLALVTAGNPWLLVSCLSSFASDYCLRQKMGGTHLTMNYLRQVPVVPPSFFQRTISRLDFVGHEFVLRRNLELTYTAWDLEPFGSDCGWAGPPFKWSDERRFLLKGELDAFFFHLYLPAEANGDWRRVEGEADAVLADLRASFPTPRHAVAYIMDTFPILKRRDEELFDGDYRTKRVILEIYDAMAEAISMGTPYQTRLGPPPADPSCRHPKKKIGVLAFGSLIRDPGPELEPKIVMRIKTRTPFSVEYGRFSGKTRGYAPTLVPHQRGSPVSAEILVLEDGVAVDDATNMLWRRETRKFDSKETYREGTTANSVLVRQLSDDPRVSTLLYTDFLPAGKILTPTAKDLAERAIRSVEPADEGMDGISYLMNSIACGIETPLTSAYREQILHETSSGSLEEALRKTKEAIPRRGTAVTHE